MITPSYLGETIEYSSLHACRSTLEDPTPLKLPGSTESLLLLFVYWPSRTVFAMPFSAHVNTSFLHENNAMLCHARRPLSTRNPLSSDPIASPLPSPHLTSPHSQNPFISQPACPLRSSLAHRLRSSLHGSHQPYTFSFPIVFPGKDPFQTVGGKRTGRQRLLQLVRFLVVVQDERV